MKKIIDFLLGFFSDEENPHEAGYDPVHVGIMIVSVILTMSLLFWLLWSLLVFGGGIQAKILPFIQVVFTSKTAADFGYVGYPYEMGVFEGWITNSIAMVFLVLIMISVWYIFNYTGKERKKDEN